MEGPSGPRLPLTHPFRGGRADLIFVYLPYLGVRKVLGAVKVL